MLPGDPVKLPARAGNRVVTAREDDELKFLSELFRLLPARKGFPLVTAHEPKESRAGMLSPDLSHRKVGVRRLGRGHLVVIGYRPWVNLNRKSNHLKSVFRRCRGTVRFVRRDPARQEADFVEIECGDGLLGNHEMPEVDGIECSAKEGDASR